MGAEAADHLLTLAEQFPVLPQGNDEILERLAEIVEIDPGEAQIFACLTDDSEGMMLSGDKRALRELAGLAGMADLFSSRIVVMEAILRDLCGALGSEVVRERIKCLAGSDRMVGICFSSGVADPIEALHSYLSSLAVEVEPLVLWRSDVKGDG
jgi:hypothetical protein